MKKLKLVYSIFITILLLSSCNNKTNDLQISEVKIAFFPNLTHSQALIGKSNGVFAKALGEDVDIIWHEFNAGPSEIEAMFAGEVDLGYIGPVPAINGYVKSNGDLKIIAGATDGGAVLVSRPDITINNVLDLSGKKIAVPQFGNTQHLVLLNLLRENDLKSTDRGGTVEVVQVANPDILTLLDKGDLDAALVPEPWGTRLIDEIGANVVLDHNQVGGNGTVSTAVVIVRTEFLKKHPDIVEKFLKAHTEITAYINENPDEAKTIANKQIDLLTNKPLPQQVLDQSFDRMDVVYTISEQSIYNYAEILKEEGFIDDFQNKELLFDVDLLNKLTQEYPVNEE